MYGVVIYATKSQLRRQILLEVSLKLDTRPEQYCHNFKKLSIYDKSNFHMFRLVSRGHTGICNLHALSSEKEKNSKLLAKPFCRRHASSIPARSTQEEKPDQLDQEKVHRWESSRNTKYDAFLHFLATP